MNFFISIVLAIAGLASNNPAALISAGLFAIAGSIDLNRFNK